jgi:hypothetical protein
VRINVLLIGVAWRGVAWRGTRTGALVIVRIAWPGSAYSADIAWLRNDMNIENHSLI